MPATQTAAMNTMKGEPPLMAGTHVLINPVRRNPLLPGLALLVAWVLCWTATATAAELPDFRQLVKDNSPSVVNISTVQRAHTPAAGSPFGRTPEDVPEFFRRFFGEPFGGGRSLGSGFIISSDGYILTNNHVVEDADEIIVRLIDRRELEATVVGSDPRSDLALLKVESDEPLPAVRVGDSEKLEVGEWVLAIGSPFGFDYSVTAGIVSAKKRSIPNEHAETYVPFIQTDVAINPGNSGGPLFNLDGEVVAINSQIYTRSGGFMGVSFHIPIDVAMDVVDQLRENQRVSRGWIGVQIQEVNRDLAESFGLDKPAGALVSRVLPDTPAEAAGVLAGDIILDFDGTPIQFSAELPYLVGRTRPGTRVPMNVVRDGNRKRLMIEVGELAPSDELAASGSGGAATGTGRIGMRVEALAPATLERLGVDGGVRVVEVADAGPAYEAGIRAGDVITRLNNVRVDGLDAFADAVAALPAGRSVPVLVVRDGTPMFLPLRVPD